MNVEGGGYLSVANRLIWDKDSKTVVLFVVCFVLPPLIFSFRLGKDVFCFEFSYQPM